MKNEKSKMRLASKWSTSGELVVNTISAKVEAFGRLYQCSL